MLIKNRISLVGKIVLLFIFSCRDPKEKINLVPLATDTLSSVESISPETTGVSSTIINRVAWQKPNFIIEKLGRDLKGKVIADIGAGPTGFFSMLLAKQGAQVLAIDIDPAALLYIEKEKISLDSTQRHLIKTRLARVDDPRLHKEEIDGILIVNTMAYLGNKPVYLQNLKNNLKPGGKIVIVDFKMKRLPTQIAPPKNERIYEDLVEEYLYQAGFKNITLDDQTLNYQYIITAEK